MKVCTRCKSGKELSEFGNRVDAPSGHQSWCKACAKDYNHKHYLSLKIAAFEYYGGPVCICCGETEICFLSLDHKNNDGSEQRRRDCGKQSGRGGNIYYRWLKNNNYPDLGLQVSCHNCNQGRFINGGVCPHQVLRDVA